MHGSIYTELELWGKAIGESEQGPVVSFGL